MFYFLFRHLDHVDESKMGLYDLPGEEHGGLDAEAHKGNAGLGSVDEKRALAEKEGHHSPTVRDGGSAEKREA